jgi:hypothetical protein
MRFGTDEIYDNWKELWTRIDESIVFPVHGDLDFYAMLSHRYGRQSPVGANMSAVIDPELFSRLGGADVLLVSMAADLESRLMTHMRELSRIPPRIAAAANR